MVFHIVAKWFCISLALLVLLIAYPFTAFSNTDLNFSAEEIAWMKENPVVRVAPDPDFPQHLSKAIFPTRYISTKGPFQ